VLGQLLLQVEPWSRQGSHSAELLAMVTEDEQPLSAYGGPQLAKRVSQSLSRILIVCHSMLGNYRLFNTSRCAKVLWLPCPPLSA
jgi:hypothetical protein